MSRAARLILRLCGIRRKKGGVSGVGVLLITPMMTTTRRMIPRAAAIDRGGVQ